MERQQILNTAVTLANDFGFNLSNPKFSNGNLEITVDSNCELARFFELALINELRSSVQPEYS